MTPPPSLFLALSSWSEGSPQPFYELLHGEAHVEKLIRGQKRRWWAKGQWCPTAARRGMRRRIPCPS